MTCQILGSYYESLGAHYYHGLLRCGIDRGLDLVLDAKAFTEAPKRSDKSLGGLGAPTGEISNE